MSDGELISHPVSEATPGPANIDTPAHTATAEPHGEAPKVESPAIQSRIEETGRVADVTRVIQPEHAPVTAAPSVEPIADTAAKEPIAEIPAPERKLPPVTQLPEPVARLVEDAPGSAPPDFLREHATRTIAATPLRAEPKPPFRPKLAPVLAAKPDLKAPPRPELKSEPKTGPKPERAPRQTRFALLAACLAMCAGLGATLGSAGVASLSRVSAPAPAPAPAGTAADVQALREQIAQLAAELAATRTSVEHITRESGTRFGKLVERFDRIERTQAEPAAKLAKIGETLDKVEKRLASLPTAPAPNPNDVTGSVTPRPAPETKAPPKPRILEEFSLRRVYDGVALVEGRRGVVELVPGAPLPGGGRVEDIRREDGHWVVITTRGLIISQR